MEVFESFDHWEEQSDTGKLCTEGNCAPRVKAAISTEGNGSTFSLLTRTGQPGYD